MTNQYRAKYGIPYTDEIVDVRKRYGISAAKMSQILGIGVNQYRLYEQGEVPSVSNGRMIRSVMIVKHTDDTAKTVINLFDDIQNEVNKNTSFGVTGRFKDLEKAGKIKADKDNLINQLKDVYNDLHDENFRKELEKRKMEIHQVFLQLKLEAVLNTNQFKDE